MAETSFFDGQKALKSRAIFNGSQERKAYDPSKPPLWSFLSATKEEPRLKIYSEQVLKTAMNSLNGLQGGFIVPVEYSLALMKSFAEKSFFWDKAVRIPMKTMTIQCPTPNLARANSAGTAPYFLNAKFTWGQGITGQGGSIPDASGTNPVASITLRAWDLIGQLTISNQLLEDTGEEGEKALVEILGEGAAWYMDWAFFNGTGTANEQPIGVVNAPCTILTTRAGAGHIAEADVSKMAKSMYPHGWVNSCWLCSPTAFEDISKITNFQKNESPLEVIAGFAGFLLSRPLYVTEKLPALGNVGDLVYIDPSMYVIGDRMSGQAQIEMSATPLFSTNQTVIKVWARADGQPLLSKFITMADGSSTSSAFVALNA